MRRSTTICAAASCCMAAAALLFAPTSLGSRLCCYATLAGAALVLVHYWQRRIP